MLIMQVCDQHGSCMLASDEAIVSEIVTLTTQQIDAYVEEHVSTLISLGKEHNPSLFILDFLGYKWSYVRHSI